LTPAKAPKLDHPLGQDPESAALVDAGHLPDRGPPPPACAASAKAPRSPSVIHDLDELDIGQHLVVGRETP
jgi:hypothetical protein